MELSVFQHRQPLEKTLQALRNKALTLGFIGGSITDGRPRHNWPEAVVSWFVEHFSDVRVYVENAAIGATGSELAVFRVERDLLQRGCQLVFVEFAVNDQNEEADKRMKTREGLLRKLLGSSQCDVILVYTYSQDMYAEMNEGHIPSSILDFELLAQHYSLNSIWMGLYALEEVKKGRMRWEEWLPDGLHPTSRGSLSYAQAVTTFLQKELSQKELSIDSSELKTEVPKPLPQALHPQNWASTTILPFSKVECWGAWSIRRSTDLVWMEQLLETAAIGSRLAFSFTGRGLILGFDFGKASAEFAYRLSRLDQLDQLDQSEGSEWVKVNRKRPEWLGNSGLYSIITLADNLEEAEHFFELEVIHGNLPECTGTNFRLALIGIILAEQNDDK